MKIFKGKMQFGDHSILLEIGDENLVQFVEKEYITRMPTTDPFQGMSLSVDPYTSGVSYIIRERGIMKKKVTIPNGSDTAYKEFILQGMIEMALADTGIFFMHASSFIDKGTLHVFLGPSGSGKTTILKRMGPKKITSNDTLVLVRNDDGSVDVAYPSPFDGTIYGYIKAKKLPTPEINFYALAHTRVNKLTPLLMHEQIELLVQNMNKYMFSVQKDVARRAGYKESLQKEAIKLAFFLSKHHALRLSFHRQITKTQFVRMTQNP